MVKPTLLVLAAGMGSRYGSLKQMDGVGPNNEAIIDYSVYDAIRAGFGKVVFVIRHSFEKEFREVFSAERFGGRIAVEFVFQELDYLPQGACCSRRARQAVGHQPRRDDGGGRHPRTLRRDQCRRLLRCRSLQDHRGLPFAVGREPEPLLHGRLRPRQDPFGQRYRFARRLRCGCCGQPHLDGRAHADRAYARRQDRLPRRRRRRSTGRGHAGVDEPLWLHPRFFTYSREYFKTWLAGNKENLKAEFYIPTMVNKLIGEGTASLRVLRSAAQWHGVTYKEDKPRWWPRSRR